MHPNIFYEQQQIKHTVGVPHHFVHSSCWDNKLLSLNTETDTSFPFNSAFIRNLFPENLNVDKKGRPTTASSKIKVRARFNDQKAGTLSKMQ